MTEIHLPRVVAIIQARTQSARLPGKVLLDLAGRPMLEWVVMRARQAQTLSEVWVATTSDPSDDALADWLADKSYPHSRGSLFDVLDRYYQAVQASRAEVIVRITADCPLIDPALIDAAVLAFLGHAPPAPPDSLPYPWDFVANRLPPPWGRTYPIGLDVEVCHAAGLERAWREAQQTHQREHVMPFFYDRTEVLDSRRLADLGAAAFQREAPFAQAEPRQFKALLLNHSEDLGALRWTVDTPQDLEVLRTTLAHFAPRLDFSWLEVLEFFRRNPQLGEINAGVHHKNVFEVDDRQQAV